MALDDRKNLQDPTPIVGAATDIAPLGGPKPPHERTADEEAGAIDWERLAASERFRNLLKAKRRFVVPAMIFFIVYYFALPVLIGYARPFMERRVLGPVNLAYLFALSQFFMAWIVAGLYVRAAARFDQMAADAVSERDSAQLSNSQDQPRDAVPFMMFVILRVIRDDNPHAEGSCNRCHQGRADAMKMNQFCM